AVHRLAHVPHVPAPAPLGPVRLRCPPDHRPLHSFPTRRSSDVAKRLLDYNQHAPTTYFPLLVPECLLIEPTETETKEALDEFVEVMTKILEEAKTNPELVKGAPYSQPVRRLDDVRAARELDLVWRPAV